MSSSEASTSSSEVGGMATTTSIEVMGQRARKAGQILAATSIESRNKALCNIRDALTARAQDITTANELDLAAAKSASLDPAIIKVRKNKSFLQLEESKLKIVFVQVFVFCVHIKFLVS